MKNAIHSAGRVKERRQPPGWSGREAKRPQLVDSPKEENRNGEEATQAIWNGTISFSLVAIPVHLIRAVGSGHVSFHLLHSKDNSPLQRRMFCPKEEKIVSPDEIIRGYEIGPGQYIVITDEELESVSPERSRTIEILEFIDLKDVEPIYYDHPYYLLPSKGGEKAYRLLAEVLRRTEKAGLAKFVLGEREYLVAVKSMDGVLSLITLHYCEEILPDKDMVPKSDEFELVEKGRIKKIIKTMNADFNPKLYTDERRKRIIKLLGKKSPVEAPEIEEEEQEGLVDLVAALEDSMRKVKKNR